VPGRDFTCGEFEIRFFYDCVGGRLPPPPIFVAERTSYPSQRRRLDSVVPASRLLFFAPPAALPRARRYSSNSLFFLCDLPPLMTLLSLVNTIPTM